MFGRDMLTIHVLPFFQNCFRNSINIWTVLNHQSSLLVKLKKMANSPSWMFYYRKKMTVVTQYWSTGSPHTLTTIYTSSSHHQHSHKQSVVRTLPQELYSKVHRKFLTIIYDVDESMCVDCWPAGQTLLPWGACDQLHWFTYFRIRLVQLVLKQ